MNSKQKKLFQQAQKYAGSAQHTYTSLAKAFEKDVTFHDAFLKIAQQKEKALAVLEKTSGLTTKSGKSESTFVLVMMKVFGKKRILKLMAGSETEQGDVLRTLSKEFPALKSIAQETYLQTNSLLRLRDQLIHSKKRKKR